MPQTTEQLAPATIASLIPGMAGTVIQRLIPTLTQLTTEQPTTAELEEAIKTSRTITAELESSLKTSKAITRACFEWLAARYYAKAQSEAALNPGLQALRNVAAEFAGIPVETAAEAEEMDRIEAAHPAVFHLPLAQ